MKAWYILVLIFVLGGCTVDWSQWETMQNGEEFKLAGTLVCCQCGLTHNLTYRIEGNDTYVRMWRNKWLTAERRKYLQANDPKIEWINATFYKKEKEIEIGYRDDGSVVWRDVNE